MAREKKCGHKNIHVEPNLVCEKPLGHEGNHGATEKVKTLQLSAMLDEHEASKFTPEPAFLPDGVTPILDAYGNQRVLYTGETYSEWSDLAGTPADQIKPGSPGIQVIQSGEFAGQAGQAKLEALQAELLRQEQAYEERIANLEKLVLSMAGPEEEKE